MKRRGVRGMVARGLDSPGPALENTVMGMGMGMKATLVGIEPAPWSMSTGGAADTLTGMVGVARAGGPVRAAVVIMMAVVGGAGREWAAATCARRPCCC